MGARAQESDWGEGVAAGRKCVQTRRAFFRLRFARVRWVLWLAVVCGPVAVPRALAQSSREYDLKAVLLLNLTRFVEWPPAAFSAPGSPLVIGILGQDPFGKVLEEVVQNEKCGPHSIGIIRYQNVQAVRDCQILFVSASEQGDLPRILAVLQGRPILTVGDFEGFALRGGMVRFMKSPADKIHLRINLNATRTSGLTVSAKLLRVAEVVRPSED